MRKQKQIDEKALAQLIEAFDKLLIPAGEPHLLFKTNSIKVRNEHDLYIVQQYNEEYSKRLNRYMLAHYGESMLYCRADIERIKYNAACEMNEYLHYKIKPTIRYSTFIVEDLYDEADKDKCVPTIKYETW